MPTNLPINVFTNVKIEQTLVGDQYLCRVYIGGEKLHEVVNSVPMEYNDVTTYASDPWTLTADAVIRNLMFGKSFYLSTLYFHWNDTRH